MIRNSDDTRRRPGHGGKQRVCRLPAALLPALIVSVALACGAGSPAGEPTPTLPSDRAFPTAANQADRTFGRAVAVDIKPDPTATVTQDRVLPGNIGPTRHTGHARRAEATPEKPPLPRVTTPVIPEPATMTTPDLSGTELSWRPVFYGNQLRLPVRLLPWPTGGIAVVSKLGIVDVYTDGGKHTALDMEDLTFAKHAEAGLLDLIIDPDWPERPFVYIWYSPSAALPDAEGRLHFLRLSRMELRADGSVDPDTELVILEPQKVDWSPIHNGGTLGFGPEDGMLYLSLGDGGGPNGGAHARDLGLLWGKIVRIDISQSTAAEPYLVPEDNPFLDRDYVRPEIWAHGFRNPWRWDFGWEPDTLLVADVGGNRQEEVTVVRAGDDAGWPVYEGYLCRRSNCPSSGMVAPLHSYPHQSPSAIIGGYVYHGSALPVLRGLFIFGDYPTGRVWALAPDGSVVELPETGHAINSFGLDASGELYVLSHWRPARKLVLGN